MESVKNVILTSYQEDNEISKVGSKSNVLALSRRRQQNKDCDMTKKQKIKGLTQNQEACSLMVGDSNEKNENNHDNETDSCLH